MCSNRSASSITWILMGTGGRSYADRESKYRRQGIYLLGVNASATARVISRRWNDDDEISYLVEETGVPGGNRRPTASNWWNFSHREWADGSMSMLPRFIHNSQHPLLCRHQCAYIIRHVIRLIYNLKVDDELATVIPMWQVFVGVFEFEWGICGRGRKMAGGGKEEQGGRWGGENREDRETRRRGGTRRKRRERNERGRKKKK